MVSLEIPLASKSLGGWTYLNPARVTLATRSPSFKLARHHWRIKIPVSIRRSWHRPINDNTPNAALASSRICLRVACHKLSLSRSVGTLFVRVRRTTSVRTSESRSDTKRNNEETSVDPKIVQISYGYFQSTLPHADQAVANLDACEETVSGEVQVAGTNGWCAAYTGHSFFSSFQGSIPSPRAIRANDLSCSASVGPVAVPANPSD